MLMSILAFIKLKNISSTQKEPQNSAPKSGGSFG